MSKRLTVIIIINLFVIDLWAQNEKVTIESSEEEVEEGSFEQLLDAYNHVIRAREEKLTLLKIDLLSPFLYAVSDGEREEDELLIESMVKVSFEKKYRPDWSWFTRIKLMAINRRLRESNLSGGIRYYYNLNRRILKGKSANNLSANYVAVEPNLRFNYGRGDSGFSVKLLYGIQRRIGKRGYVDFDIGLENMVAPYTEKEFGIEVTGNLELGLAF